MQAMFMNDENKRHGQAIKIARETSDRDGDNNFRSQRRVSKCL